MQWLECFIVESQIISCPGSSGIKVPVTQHMQPQRGEKVASINVVAIAIVELHRKRKSVKMHHKFKVQS